MKTFFIGSSISLIAVTFAVTTSGDNHPINQGIVDDILSKTKKWVPHDPSDNPLKNRTHAQLHMLLGTRIVPPLRTLMPVSANANIPKDFDAREYWKDLQCVHPVRNQEQCGSCWAFAASEAFSDRVCIASKGGLNTIFSPESLVECDKVDQACNGGELQNVWRFLESDGIVTDECKPYTSGEGKVAQCSLQCQDQSLEYKRYFCKKGSVVEAVTRDQIKEQLFTYGPMETGFEVYHDFFNYKGGVYHHVTGELAGGHAVKILGWGTDEDGTAYWICANSWGPTWGESGFFRIQMGEGGIDASVWGCIPDVTPDTKPVGPEVPDFTPVIA